MQCSTPGNTQVGKLKKPPVGEGLYIKALRPIM